MANVGYSQFTDDVIEICKPLTLKYGLYYEEQDPDEKDYTAILKNSSIAVDFYIQHPYGRVNFNFVKAGTNSLELREKIDLFLDIDERSKVEFFKANHQGIETDLKETCRHDLLYLTMMLDHFYGEILNEKFDNWDEVMKR